MREAVWGKLQLWRAAELDGASEPSHEFSGNTKREVLIFEQVRAVAILGRAAVVVLLVGGGGTGGAVLIDNCTMFFFTHRIAVPVHSSLACVGKKPTLGHT